MSAAPVTAIVLAAGIGTRLRPHTEERPKCMVPVGGRPILERTLQGLADGGVRTVCVVLGYRSEDIRQFVEGRFPGLEIRFAVNPAFAATGTCVSLLHGLDATGAGGPLLIIEGDVVFETALLDGLLDGGCDAATVVAPYHPLLTGTYVTLDDAGWVSDWLHERVRPAGFDLRPAFKTVNITRLPAAAVTGTLLPALRETIDRDGPTAPLEFALRRCIRDHRLRIRGHTTGDHRWFEVDTIEDLQAAELLFAPSGLALTFGIQQAYG